MKAAGRLAVYSYAHAAGAWRDRDTDTIAALRRESHALANRLTVAEGGIQLIGEALGLPGDTPIPDVIEAALGRLR